MDVELIPILLVVGIVVVDRGRPECDRGGGGGSESNAASVYPGYTDSGTGIPTTVLTAMMGAALVATAVAVAVTAVGGGGIDA